MATIDTNSQQSVTIDDVITTVVMARVTDFFGFFVYAIASALVFPAVFFPHLDPISGTLWSFTLFSLAFLARPIASLAGRSIQAKIGRAGKITLALMVLGVSTVAIGLLPGYERLVSSHRSAWRSCALFRALGLEDPGMASHFSLKALRQKVAKDYTGWYRS